MQTSITSRQFLGMAHAALAPMNGSFRAVVGAVRGGALAFGASSILGCGSGAGETAATNRSDGIIHDQDDRVDYYEATDGHKRIMDSVAMLALPDMLEKNCDGDWVVNTTLTLDEYVQHLHDKDGKPLPSLCAGERYATQPSVGTASAFPISRTRMLTAAHVFKDPRTGQISAGMCDLLFAVFGFRYGGPERLNTVLPSDHVYWCERILQLEYDPTTHTDWAVFELNRELAPSIKELRLDTRNPEYLPVGEPVWIPGYPHGLPEKAAMNAVIKQNDGTNSIFFTDADTFGGTSGSPIISERSNRVIGIHIGGPTFEFFSTRRGGANLCSEYLVVPSSTYAVAREHGIVPAMRAHARR